jgi:hypothetical protein
MLILFIFLFNLCPCRTVYNVFNVQFSVSLSALSNFTSLSILFSVAVVVRTRCPPLALNGAAALRGWRLTKVRAGGELENTRKFSGGHTPPITQNRSLWAVLAPFFLCFLLLTAPN